MNHILHTKPFDAIILHYSIYIPFPHNTPLYLCLSLPIMAPNAKVISTKIFAILNLGARSIKVGYVEETDIWKRITISPAIQMKFKEVVEKNLSSLREDTEMVALQLVSYNRNLFSMLTFHNIGRLHTQANLITARILLLLK